MAFSWEVEALGKMIEAIIASTASEYNKAADELDDLTTPDFAEEVGGKYGIDEKGLVTADEVRERWGFAKDILEKRKHPAKRKAYIDEEEKKVRDALELDPDDPLPRYEIDEWGNVWDLTIQDELLRRELSERTSDPNDPRNYDWDDRDKFLQAQRTYEAQQERKDAAIKTLGEMDDPFGLSEVAPWEGISYEEFYESLRDVDDSPLTEQEIEESNAAADAERYGLGYKEKDKLKLDWVNEILKEFPEDKTPEVISLPHWTIPVPDHLKDEKERPDMSPFLSYLLRQSPYARLPAAGLLAAGLMGYSKPAY